jgi:two-component system chemotaxis sensor kinase CheA
VEIDEQLILRTFFAECDEKLLEMEEAVVVLETRPTDPELLATIFRIVHTVKGNGASLGFETVAAFAHRLEELLERMRSGEVAVTPPLASLLLHSVDLLRSLLRQAQADGGSVGPVGIDTAVPRDILDALAGVPGEDGTDLPHAILSMAPVRVSGDEGRARSHGTLRVDLRKLDRLLDLTGEAAVARCRMAESLSRGAGPAELEEIWSSLDGLFGRLQELITAVRMVPVGPLFRQQIRVIHDLMESRGKSARLLLEGEDVEVDASVLEQLRDPVTHLVRNAVDHGIESPEERLACGKDPCGRITLRAFHAAGSLIVEVEDDGAGLDRACIAERARALPGVESPELLPDAELFRLVFEPGFSTSPTVTDLSGRGVGLDVVRRNIEALRGSVSIQGAPGRGSTVTLRLPLTLAIIDGLTVEAGGEVFVVPLESVVECVDLPPEESSGDRISGLISLRGAPLPYLRLREHFLLDSQQRGRESVVVVESEGRVAGIAVDALLGKSQTVIKPLGRLFMGVKGLSGSAVLGSGRVALIVDVATLLREAVRREAHAGETLASFS